MASSIGATSDTTDISEGVQPQALPSSIPLQCDPQENDVSTFRLTNGFVEVTDLWLCLKMVLCSISKKYVKTSAKFQELVLAVIKYTVKALLSPLSIKPPPYGAKI